MNKRLWWFPAARLSALLIAACIAHSAAAQPLTLRYGQDWSSAHSIYSLPISVAQREGLFRREGLNVQVIIPVPGGSDKMVFDGLNKGWIERHPYRHAVSDPRRDEGRGCGCDQRGVQKRDL